MGQTRLQIAKPEIARFFRETGKILKRREIDEIASRMRSDWNLKSSTTKREFVNFLVTEGILTEHKMKFPHRKETRYTMGEVSIHQIVQSLRQEGYFTHRSALEIHNLVDSTHKTQYYNIEQSPKDQYSDELTQEGIDIAFQNKCRVSRNKATLRDNKVYLLSGKNTGQLGVVATSDRAGGEIRVTNIERTLIDSTVRPVYAGGVRTVAKAFRRAAGRLSTSKLLELLTELDYVYPYNQAIGFYLDKTGAYGDDQLSRFEAADMELDFYLAHDMKNPKHSERWRIYYPRGL